MKRWLLLCISFILFVQTAHAEEIKEFRARYDVRTDGKVTVTETIQYEFTTPRHGIYRTIPFIWKNKENQEYQMDIRVDSVTDGKGSPYHYATSTVDDSVQIKIGSADSYVEGMKDYVITYDLSGALTYFSDHDELYWNVTGNGWEIPIRRATAEVVFPDTIAADSVTSICFTGKKGSDEHNCTSTIDKSVTTVQTKSILLPNEGLTFAV